MNTKKRKNLLAYTMAFAMIILMAAASELSHNHEFILPEIAAMVIAMWVYRDPNWLRHPLQIFLAPTLTSVIGFTVNHLPAAYLCKVGIDFILIYVFFPVSDLYVDRRLTLCCEAISEEPGVGNPRAGFCGATSWVVLTAIEWQHQSLG